MKINELIQERGQTMRSMKRFLLAMAEFYDIEVGQPLPDIITNLAKTLELDIMHFASDWFRQEKPNDLSQPVTVKSLHLGNADDRARVAAVLTFEHILSDELEDPPRDMMARAEILESAFTDEAHAAAESIYMEWLDY